MAPCCARAHFLMNEWEASGVPSWSRRSIGPPSYFCSRIIWGSHRMTHLPTMSCTGYWKIQELERHRGVAVSAIHSAHPEGESSRRKARLTAVGEYGVTYGAAALGL